MALCLAKIKTNLYCRDQRTKNISKNTIIVIFLTDYKHSSEINQFMITHETNSDEAFSAYRDSDTVVQNTKKDYLSKYYNFT